MGLDLHTMLYSEDEDFLPTNAQLRAAVEMLVKRGLVRPAALESAVAKIDDLDWHGERGAGLELPTVAANNAPDAKPCKPAYVRFHGPWSGLVGHGDIHSMELVEKLSDDDPPLEPTGEVHDAAKGSPIPGFCCWNEHVSKWDSLGMYTQPRRWDEHPRSVFYFLTSSHLSILATVHNRGYGLVVV